MYDLFVLGKHMKTLCKKFIKTIIPSKLRDEGHQLQYERSNRERVVLECNFNVRMFAITKKSALHKGNPVTAGANTLDCCLTLFQRELFRHPHAHADVHLFLFT